ncbi:MAG: hypothetical protein RLZZ325_553, partial [Pseudomonadota bacterium]
CDVLAGDGKVSDVLDGFGVWLVGVSGVGPKSACRPS